MNLYSLTLQQTTGIAKAIPGRFSGAPQQEIVVSKVKHIELLRWNDQAAKLQSVSTQEVFGMIRDMQIFRLPGFDRDHVIIGTDAGRVVIMLFDDQRNQFIKVHQETYGKTGSRRIVPGQFIACDPKGRAFMVSACERNKFVYILNRENERVMVSSPLEAPKSHAIVFDIIGLDTGYDNPEFAALEVDYGEWQDKESVVCTGQITKFLTIYEMDIGVNNVKRRTSDPVDENASQLLMVPFVPDGPGGVIVLCQDFLIYRNRKGNEKRVPYPRRLGAPGDRGVMINNVAFHKHKGKFLYILQTELGDLFELQIHFTHEDVHTITLQYFDSIPVASSLCFMRQGFLFSACERGNHILYQILSLGQDEQIATITDSSMKQDDLVYFSPRKLLHLKHFDEMRNYTCITQVHVSDLVNEGNPQIYTLCAAGSRSTLRVLRHGLAVTQLANTTLPGNPLAIWTIKQRQNDEYHKYIILSFLNQTVVLSISQVVAEAKDSGLENQRQSLHVGLLEDNSILQVLSNGYRHIKHVDGEINVIPWICEGKVIKACSNSNQVCLGLAGGEIFYFELLSSGQLQQIAHERMENEITALELGPIEEGRIRSTLLAVGLSDYTVRLLSLEPDSCLEKLSIQALPSLAESLCMMEMASIDYGLEQQQTMQIQNTQLFLFLGLNNGVLMRSSVDQLSGQLSDTRTRYLGTKQVKCFRVVANGQPGMLALSSRPWLCYNHNQRIYMQPLSYDNLDYAASFNTKEFVGGIVGINGKKLRIIAPDKYGELFNETIIPLSYSPRKMIVHEEAKTIVIIESDNRAYSYKENIEKKQDISIDYDVPEIQCQLYAPVYKWAACCRIIDPKNLQTIQLHEFQNNEHAVSITYLQFAGYDEQYVCIGTVKDLQNEPIRKFTEGIIHTFIISKDGTQLILLHSTQIDEVPYSLSPWRGRLLVGAGPHLRVYEMGKKRLLKKAELKSMNSFITSIHVHHDRIFTTLASDSVHLLRYRIKEQTFMEIADDILPRWITASCLMDYHTIIAADKFENFFVSRVPMDIDMEQEEHPFEFKMKMDQGCMNGAPFKMDQICNYYYGEVITSLQKAALVSTANEVIVFGTSMGSIGALFPFDSREDIDFFIHLEMYLRVETIPLSGRDHMMYRSFYGPCKSVIDGDLCEEFASLAYSKQKNMSEEFDRTPADIMKKLEDVRNKIL